MESVTIIEQVGLGLGLSHSLGLGLGLSHSLQKENSDNRGLRRLVLCDESAWRRAAQARARRSVV